MKYEKKVNVEGIEYTFVLQENSELIFYTINKEHDPFAKWGDEPNKSFNNLHGKINPYSLLIEIEKFIRYLFANKVTYLYFSCERERFDIYESFISRLVEKYGYNTTAHKQRNEFYVYKSR